MISRAKKYKTGAGHEVYLISEEGRGDYPIVGQVLSNLGNWYTACWDKAGNSPTACFSDALVEAASEKLAYFNVYRNLGSKTGPHIGERANISVADAKALRSAAREYLGIVKLTTKGDELISAEVVCNN